MFVTFITIISGWQFLKIYALLSNHGLSRYSCLHLGSLHPRIFEKKVWPNIANLMAANSRNRFCRLHTWSWTLAKSTLLRSWSIWLTWLEFCNTALAAWARWFNPVYLLKVWANDFTAFIWNIKSVNYLDSVAIMINWLWNTFKSFRVSGTEVKADTIQVSKFFENVLIPWVRAFGIGFNTFGSKMSIKYW